MKFKSFESKTKNIDLDAFDLLLHHVHMLDVMFQSATEVQDSELQKEVVDRMLDANDRYLTVVLGLEGEEQKDDTEPKQGFGFNHTEPQMESISTPDSEPGGLQ